MPGGRVFLEDVKQALRAWRDPRVPLLTAWLYLLTSLPELLSTPIARTVATWSFLPVGLFSIGYVGVERLWYLRMWRGQRMSGGEMWSRSWFYLRRYLGLGIIVIVPVLPIYAVATFASEPGSAVVLAVSGALTLVLDLFITFATPALAYTTENPREAIRINLTMVKSHRPAVWFYVFVPSLAVVLSFQITGRDIVDPVAFVVLGVVTTLFNLLMKGATAAFYLRFNEVGEL